MSQLANYRKKIDSIDKKVAKLLDSRFSIAKKISAIKKSSGFKIADKRRENEVLQNVMKQSRKHNEFLVMIFKKIINYSKKLQR